MPRRLRLLLVSFALASCTPGTTKDFESPVSACQSIGSAYCMRLSQCQPGVDVDTCTTQYENYNNCDAHSCGTNVYNPGGAQQCYNDTLALDCPDLEASNFPVSCAASNICLAPDAGP